MQIKITARHGHLSEELQNHIREKAGKLEHIFPRLMMIEVLVDMQNEQKIVEFLVSAEHKHDFVASERNKELLAAVDLVLAKLEGQIRKYKEKVQNHHRGSTKGEFKGAPETAEEQQAPAAALYEDSSMRMSEFIIREAISANLTANQKEGIIREMVENLRRAGYFKGSESEDVVKAILKREMLSSTGIGDGVAIPHAKHESVDRLVGAVALSTAGVPFDSVDNEPVNVLVMLISPKERPGEHLRALEGVSRCLKDKNFVQSLRQMTTPQQIWDLICSHDRGA